MTDPANPSSAGEEVMELRVPVSVAGYVGDAVHEARKNYEEDGISDGGPDAVARRIGEVESQLDRAVFG